MSPLSQTEFDSRVSSSGYITFVVVGSIFPSSFVPSPDPISNETTVVEIATLFSSSTQPEPAYRRCTWLYRSSQVK